MSSIQWKDKVYRNNFNCSIKQLWESIVIGWKSILKFCSYKNELNFLLNRKSESEIKVKKNWTKIISFFKVNHKNLKMVKKIWALINFLLKNTYSIDNFGQSTSTNNFIENYSRAFELASLYQLNLVFIHTYWCVLMAHVSYTSMVNKPNHTLQLLSNYRKKISTANIWINIQWFVFKDKDI